jgi:outer membrane protein OmpA-like peptidoglycan-associated protein
MQNDALIRAESQYETAQADPKVVQYAPVELDRAETALRDAQKAARESRGEDEVVHRAYVAQQQAALAQESAKLRAAEAYIARAGTEQTQVQLEARTREAQEAQRQADLALQEARAAREGQLSAEQQALQAQQQAQQAANQAQQAAERERALQQQLGAKETDRGLVLTLSDLLFETNKAQLQPGGNRSIDKLASTLRQYPERRIRIEGFTDSVGSNEHNQHLSEQRAQAVRQALIDKGIEANRIEIQGYGEEYPVATNNTAAGRQLNRRVEIIISGEDGDVGP